MTVLIGAFCIAYALRVPNGRLCTVHCISTSRVANRPDFSDCPSYGDIRRSVRISESALDL